LDINAVLLHMALVFNFIRFWLNQNSDKFFKKMFRTESLRGLYGAWKGVGAQQLTKCRTRIEIVSVLKCDLAPFWSADEHCTNAVREIEFWEWRLFH